MLHAPAEYARASTVQHHIITHCKQKRIPVCLHRRLRVVVLPQRRQPFKRWVQKPNGYTANGIVCVSGFSVVCAEV